MLTATQLLNIFKRSQTPTAVYADSGFTIQFANEAMLNLWGKDESIIGSSLEQALPGQTASLVLDQLKQFCGSNRQQFMAKAECPLYVDGDLTWLLCRNRFESVGGGAILHTAEVIPQQKTVLEELAEANEGLAAADRMVHATNGELIQAQRDLQRTISELAESEHRIRSIVANAPFPIGVYEGREMRIAMTNRAIMDVWGKGYDVVGKLFSEVLPELADQNIFEQLDAVYTTGIPLHIRQQRIDLISAGKPKTFYFNYSFTPFYDMEGRVYGVMNTAADVTDLYLAKQKLERSEQNLHNIILHAPVAMAILSGPEHIITVANNKIIELWGKPAEAVMNKPVFDALPDARHQGLEELIASVYSSGETFHANEMPVSLIRNGRQEVIYQNFVYQPYRNAEGDIDGVVAITIDITEQVLARKKIEQSEAELRATKKRLEAELEAGKELERQKDSFIGIASHELKTPLTSLTAIIQVAQAKLRNSDDAFLRGAMDTANIQLKRMSSMVNSFLNISRFEAGNIVIEKVRLDLGELIDQVIHELKFTALQHKIDYHTEGCEVIVLADRDKISSVVTNLINNAIKYSPNAQTVDVSCRVDGPEAIVSVKDQGMGINSSDLERIFDRYYRVRAFHTQHISGFGIGLYLCAEIVERHGGRIWVESEVGKGSVFYFSLPIVEA